MSDFDKEAEREKLREKYEQDQKEREATQRMSDLLLKGATMTNAHCGTCGDPLFQQNGTTFCPSCHGNPDAVEGTDLEAQPAEGAAPEGSTDGGSEPAASTDTDAPGADGAESATAGDAASTDPRRGERTPAADDAAPSSAPDRTRSPATEPDRRPPTESTADAAGRDAPRSPADDRSSDADPSRRAPAATPSSVDGDLEAARDALVRSLERFAEEAAATDDPRYARDCLAAAREAGEALSTLR